jgi:hypothetical protein
MRTCRHVGSAFHLSISSCVGLVCLPGVGLITDFSLSNFMKDLIVISLRWSGSNNMTLMGHLGGSSSILIEASTYESMTNSR